MIEQFLILKVFFLENATFSTWLVVVVVLLVGLFLQSTWLNEGYGAWRLNYLLRNIGTKSLHNICIVDSVDEKIFIEHIILTSTNILLISVKKFRGLIFAADKIDQWTQIVRNKSYKFKNPLHQLEYDTGLLNSKIENTRIVAKVLFVNGCEFPKGKPKDVISIADMKSWPKKIKHSEISKELRDDWDQLVALSVSNDLDKDIFIKNGESSSFNVFSFVVMIAFIALWLVWRTFF